MSSRSGNSFVAYSSMPEAIGAVVEPAISCLRSQLAGRIISWKEHSCFGRFISETVRAQIEQCSTFIADITEYNHNVLYEVGYAAGMGKPFLLIAKSASVSQSDYVRRYLFRNISVHEYENSESLADLLYRHDTLAKPATFTADLNTQQPVFFLMPDVKTQFVDAIKGHITRPTIAFQRGRSNISIRFHERYEDGSLTWENAQREVARSFGVVVIIQDPVFPRSAEDNIRAAVVSGLACGLRKQIVVFSHTSPSLLPIDLHDFAISVAHAENVSEKTQQFVYDVGKAIEAYDRAVATGNRAKLSTVERLLFNFAELAAENETEYISKFYLETEDYRRAYNLSARLVVGRKGMGKTALFQMLKQRWGEQLRQRSIVIELAPPDFQMIRFKDCVALIQDMSNKINLVSLFWEHVILMEAARAISRRERQGPTQRMHDLKMTERLEAIFEDVYGFPANEDNDFSLRVQQIVLEIAGHQSAFEQGGVAIIRELVNTFKGERVEEMRHAVAKYLAEADRDIRVIVDNVDKSFNSDGLDQIDWSMVRGLISGASNIRAFFERKGAQFGLLLFLRDDVYENLARKQADRGKESVIRLEWRNVLLFEQMILRRMIDAGVTARSFRDAWNAVVVPSVNGEESWEFVVSRSMMRPRFMIHFLRSAMSYAFGVGSEGQLTERDMLAGLREYSRYALDAIGDELADVTGWGRDALRIFVGHERCLSYPEVERVVREFELAGSDEEVDGFVQQLLWFGFLGIASADTERFIWDFDYDMRTMSVMWYGNKKRAARFCINKAFCPQLQINEVA